MKLLPVFLLVLAIVSVECRGKKKTKAKGGNKKTAKNSNAKAAKGVVKLCNALNAGTIVVKDEAYQSIFDEVLPGYCETMWEQLESSPSKRARNCDGVKDLQKNCKTYYKVNKEAPTSGPWMGFDAVCIEADLASSKSLLDKKSKKMLKKINKYCGAVSAGGEVFGADDELLATDVGAFCDALFLESLPESVGSHSIDAVSDLMEICDWYKEKFADSPAEEPLGGLTTVCETLDGGLVVEEAGEESGSGEIEETESTTSMPV